MTIFAKLRGKKGTQTKKPVPVGRMTPEECLKSINQNAFALGLTQTRQSGSSGSVDTTQSRTSAGTSESSVSTTAGMRGSR